MLARAVLIATVLGVLLGTAPAGAADAVVAGWWTSSPVPVAPDAGDGLLVQGGADPAQPVAFAAVDFALGSDETPVALTLTVRSDSASTPSTVLVACPLVEDFAPESGAAMTDAPAYDCATTVPSTHEESTYTFDVSTLTAAGALSLAILPSAPTDRVALELPDVGALETTTAGTTTSGDSSDGVVGDSSSSATSTASASDTGTSFDAGSSFAGSSSSDFTSTAPVGATGTTGSFDVTPAPSPATDAATASAGSGNSATATQETAAAPAADTGGDGGRSLAPILFIVLAVAAGGLWFAAGQMSSLSGADLDDAEAA